MAAATAACGEGVDAVARHVGGAPVAEGWVPWGELLGRSAAAGFRRDPALQPADAASLAAPDLTSGDRPQGVVVGRSRASAWAGSRPVLAGSQWATMRLSRRALPWSMNWKPTPKRLMIAGLVSLAGMLVSFGLEVLVLETLPWWGHLLSAVGCTVTAYSVHVWWLVREARQGGEMDIEPTEIGRLLQEKQAGYYAGLTALERATMLDRIEAVRARQQHPPHEAHRRGDSRWSAQSNTSTSGLKKRGGGSHGTRFRSASSEPSLVAQPRGRIDGRTESSRQSGRFSRRPGIAKDQRDKRQGRQIVQSQLNLRDSLP